MVAVEPRLRWGGAPARAAIAVLLIAASLALVACAGSGSAATPARVASATPTSPATSVSVPAGAPTQPAVVPTPPPGMPTLPPGMPTPPPGAPQPIGGSPGPGAPIPGGTTPPPGSPPPPGASIPTGTGATGLPHSLQHYLMSFLACDTATATNCMDPRDHTVYLAQSDDGASWTLVPGWKAYAGSVPDVIRRDDTVYIYSPGMMVRYHLDTGREDPPVAVSVSGLQAGFVDPTLAIDAAGRLVLFFLPGRMGGDPAGCAPGETSCVQHFDSATEVSGSDGASFTLDPGDRAAVTISQSALPGSASDPDIFYDGSRWVLYVSEASSVAVFTSPTLRGEYQPLGVLTNSGGVPAGYFDPATSRYWTYVHTDGPSGTVIRRAVHASLGTTLTNGEFTTVLTGASVGLGASYEVQSPGFAVNVARPAATGP